MAQKQLSAKEFKAMIQKKYAKRTPGNANALTKSILTYLASQGFKAWRNNTVGIFDQKKAVEKLLKLFTSGFLKLSLEAKKKAIYSCLKNSYRKSHDQKGASDIIGVCKKTGRMICVEVKAGKDTIKPAQEMFLNEMKKAGAIALVARSLDDVIKEVENFKQG